MSYNYFLFPIGKRFKCRFKNIIIYDCLYKVIFITGKPYIIHKRKFLAVSFALLCNIIYFTVAQSSFKQSGKSVLQSIYTFFFGLMLGYVVYRSGSLILGVVVHIVFNSVGVLFPQIIVMGNSPITFFLFLLLGMVLTYAGLILIGKCSPTGEERIGQK